MNDHETRADPGRPLREIGREIPSAAELPHREMLRQDPAAGALADLDTSLADLRRREAARLERIIASERERAAHSRRCLEESPWFAGPARA